MNRIVAAPLLVALSFTASAEVWQGRYGVADTFDFKLYNADGTLDVDEADGGSEVSLSCDEGAETTATNDFVDEGTSYSITLTAAEMRCRRIAVVVAATTTEVFFIQTQGQTAGIARSGTAQSATSTSLVLDSGAAFADDSPIGMTLVACGSTQGYCQSRAVTDYVSSTDTATVSAWTVTPSGTVTFDLFSTAPAGGDGSSFTAIPWNSAWDAEVQSEAADAINADTGDSFTAIPWNASWDAEVQSEATDALNAYDPPTRAELTSDVNGLLSSQRIITGTCDSGSTTTCVDDALTQADATQLEDRLICFDDSWCALITTFTPGTDTATTTKTAPSTRASKAYTIFPATLE